MIVLICSIYVVWYLMINLSIPLCLNNSSRVLIIIAHPDDETMFFSPLITTLSKRGVRLFLLCLSSGDYYGQGHIRRNELFEAAHRLGIDKSDVTVMDVDSLRDGYEWSPSHIVPLIIRYSISVSADVVISFDDIGVSGHTNHQSCSLALKSARSYLPDSIELLRLESPSLFRKYSSILCLFISFFRDPCEYTIVATPSSIISSWNAMRAHRSQLLWFRYLYMMTSSLLFTNTLSRVPRKLRTSYIINQ